MNKENFLKLMNDDKLNDVDIFIPIDCIVDKKYNFQMRFTLNSKATNILTKDHLHIDIIEKLLYMDIQFIIGAFYRGQYMDNLIIYVYRNGECHEKQLSFINSDDEIIFWKLSDKEKENIKIFNLINNI